MVRSADLKKKNLLSSSSSPATSSPALLAAASSLALHHTCIPTCLHPQPPPACTAMPPLNPTPPLPPPPLALCPYPRMRCRGPRPCPRSWAWRRHVHGRDRGSRVVALRVWARWWVVVQATKLMRVRAWVRQRVRQHRQRGGGRARGG